MTTIDAATSLRDIARKLDAWARAAEVLCLPDADVFASAMKREARRVRADADELAPAPIDPKQKQQSSETTTQDKDMEQ